MISTPEHLVLPTHGGDGSSQYALSQTKWNSFPVSYYVNADAVTSGVDRSIRKVGQ